MKTKEEILDHLAHTVYTHKARKAIIEWLKFNGHVEVGDKVEFASHTYNRNGEKMTKGHDYMDFIDWECNMPPMVSMFTKSILDRLFNNDALFGGKAEITISVPNTAIDETDGEAVVADKLEYDFQVGDWVKYIPDSSESSTEYVEAIAHGTDGEMYLCLSNGEYVKPYYCVKYKAQGRERQELIDKLNEVL